MEQCPDFPELWQVEAKKCKLNNGQVYFYWFKVHNTDAYNILSFIEVVYCTDPIAWTVDRRFSAPIPFVFGGFPSFDPASVVLYKNGELIPCDADGKTVNWQGDPPLPSRSPNNRLVIYELPTRWSHSRSTGTTEIGNGTFQDVLALLISNQNPPSFPTVTTLNNRAHLLELGINALELLPPADSDDDLTWGYGTANYFSASFYLGRPPGVPASQPSNATNNLVNLIKACHQNGLRFFLDVVMAFSRNNPYHNINFFDFYVKVGSGDPEEKHRDGFGGDLFKYNFWVNGYHPITGQKSSFVPAREYLKTYIAHWLTYYRVDGLRLDSVNNIANYDFLQEFKDFAHEILERTGR